MLTWSHGLFCSRLKSASFRRRHVLTETGERNVEDAPGGSTALASLLWTKKTTFTDCGAFSDGEGRCPAKSELRKGNPAGTDSNKPSASAFSGGYADLLHRKRAAPTAQERVTKIIVGRAPDAIRPSESTRILECYRSKSRNGKVLCNQTTRSAPFGMVPTLLQIFTARVVLPYPWMLPEAVRGSDSLNDIRTLVEDSLPNPEMTTDPTEVIARRAMTHMAKPRPCRRVHHVFSMPASESSLEKFLLGGAAEPRARTLQFWNCDQSPVLGRHPGGRWTFAIVREGDSRTSHGAFCEYSNLAIRVLEGDANPEWWMATACSLGSPTRRATSKPPGRQHSLF